MGASLTAAGQPSARRTKVAALAPLAVLALWTLVVAAVLARIGVDNRYVFRDEINAILLGRGMAGDLSLVLEGTLARGPERMTALLAALAVWLTDSPTRQLELLHLWAALAQGLVAVPAWLAARELGLGRWQALVPAAVASTGSFAFYGIFTLNISVGLLTATLLLWAMVRALRRPGLVADLLVAVTLGLTMLARIGWAPLVVALAPAVLAATWSGRPGGERLGSWLRCLPVRLLRRHPLLAPAAVGIVLVAIITGPSTLLGGGYGGIRLTPAFHLSLVWDNTRTLGAHLAIGLAFVPLVLALPVVVRGLARPADALEGGFAWLVLGLVAAFSYAYYASMNEDRYFAVLVPSIALAAGVAVFRRPPPVWSVLAGGALVTALVATSYAWPVVNAYDYFVAPTSRFFGDVVLGKLTQRLPGAPELWAVVVTLVAVAGAAMAVALARRPRPLGRGATVAAAGLLAGVLAFELAAMDHPARKFAQQLGMTQLDAEMLELIDRAGGGDPVRPLAVDGVVQPDLDAQLQLLRAYNSSLSRSTYHVALVDDRDRGLPEGADAAIDWRDGSVATETPPPALLLTLAGAARVSFAGERLPRSEPYAWAQLVRLDEPLRARLAMRGMQADRYPLGGTPIELRVFPDAAPGRCVLGVIFAYPTVPHPVRYRLAGGGAALRGRVAPGEPVAFARPLRPRRPTTFTLSGEAATADDGIVRGPALYDVRVERCPAGG